MTELPYHPLANVFPLMEGRQFSELVDDVRRNGLNEPIVLLDGQVLDGRNRMRACLASGVAYRLEPFSGDDPVAFVISANIRRRHLDESQRAMVAAKLANLPSHRPGKSANLPGLSQPDAAGMLSVSDRSVRSAREVLDSGRADLVEKIERGQLAVSRAEKEIRDDRRKEQVKEIAKEVASVGTRYNLLHGPCLRLLTEPSESVDVICTDPPYPEEFLPVFSDLAKISLHLLRPGGVLLCMSGQAHLPQVFDRLCDSGLTYLWTAAYLTPGGQSTQVFPRKVNTFWKPILIFVNGAYLRDWFGDVTRSDVNDNDKDHHHWGQSESGIHDLMRRFVLPGDTVADPFLGGGTTAMIALSLGATFIGCDVDEAAINTTKARLADAALVA